MQWWNDLIDWTGSDDGWRVISGAVIPFVAIVVAGVIAALIGRGATKRVVSLQERESKNAAVAGVISAARKAATWGTLGHDERSYADHLAEDADIRLRLLPVSGAPIAANWAQHEIADIKRNSSTFSFQAEQSLAEFRDRMLEWQSKPSRARKLFRYDLERWKFESPDPDSDLIAKQQQWNADQSTPAAPSTRPAGSPTPATQVAPVLPASTPAAAPTTAAATAAAVPTPAPAPAPSVTAASTTATAPAARPSTNATVPFEATNETVPFDGETTPIGTGLPARPQSNADARTSSPSTQDATTPLWQRRTPAGSTGAASTSATTDADSTTGRASASANATADRDDTERDAASRPGSLDAPKVDAAAGPANTTSIPTRIADAPVEPADADETDESPYAKPLSASELRRRGDTDED